MAWNPSSLERRIENSLQFALHWKHGLLCAWGKYWKFTLIVRALSRFIENAGGFGGLAYTGDSLIQHFRRQKAVRNWRHRAHDTSYWMNQVDDFISFTISWWSWNVNIVCWACPAPWNGVRFLHAGPTFVLLHSRSQGVPAQQLNVAVAYGLAPLRIAELDLRSMDKWRDPKEFVGPMTETKNMKRSFKDTCRFSLSV